MTKQTLNNISRLIFVVIAFAQTACEMNIASNNQINGNQLASNNLNGLPPPGGLLPAAAKGPNGVPLLPASVEKNIAAEQNRVRNVIHTMSVQNNPFSHVLVSENHPPSTVVATYSPAPAPAAITKPNNPPAPANTPPAVQGYAPTSVQQARAPASYGGAGLATR